MSPISHLRPCSCAQSILVARGGRRAKHPPCGWITLVSKHSPDLVMSTLKDLPLEFQAKVAELEEGGGGFVNQGPVQGVYLDRACLSEWTQRCKSRGAYGCMYMVKVRYHYLTKKLELLALHP